MTVLYYYLFINKGIFKSIRENILYSKSIWKELVNIIYGAISFNAIPLSYSWLLVYLNNWLTMSLVSSVMIENKGIAFMLLCFFIISFIDIVGLLLITILGTMTLGFIILKRLYFELLGEELQNKEEKGLQIYQTVKKNP